MSKNSPESPLDREILATAADYYLKLQENSISGAELKAWQAWFMRSEQHQKAFRRLETLFGALEHLSIDDFTDKPAGVVEKQKDTFNKISGFAGGSVISLVTADVQEKSAPPRTTSRFIGGIAASVAVVLVAGFMMMGSVNTRSEYIAPIYQTAAAEQRIVKLSDGSIVELAADSQVTVEYEVSERRLVLDRGQAIFTVSKNPRRPFVVQAGNGTVTAIGTVFNVSRRSGDVQVRVLEGTVAVRPVHVPLTNTLDTAVPAVALVTAGKQTIYSNEGTLQSVEEVDVQADLDWRVGILTMVNRPLSSVIQELNQYLQDEIAIGDEAVGDFYFTGTVYPDQVDAWLEGLKQGYPLKVVRVGSSTILMLNEQIYDGTETIAE